MKRRDFLAFSAAAVSAGGLGTMAGGADDKQPLAGGEPLLSFGLVTDVQYADAAPEGERHYRESLPKLEAVAKDLARLALPFTLHLGDVIDRDFRSFARILPVFGRFGHPVRHLLGNHDFDVADGEKKQVSGMLGLPADHYAFSAAGVRFVMLDTNDVSTYKLPASAPESRLARDRMQALAAAGAGNAKPWNGGLSATQLAWLERELGQADRQGSPVLVCSHHPLLPAEGHQAWNHGEALAVIERHPCVKACFAGHNHAGNEVVAHGVPHITFKSLLNEPGVTAYAVLRLFPDRLVIEGRGREKSRSVPLPH